MADLKEAFSRIAVSRTLEPMMEEGWLMGTGPRRVGEITHYALQHGEIVTVGKQLRHISNEL